jgi:Superinfection immunity protein
MKKLLILGMAPLIAFVTTATPSPAIEHKKHAVATASDSSVLDLLVSCAAVLFVLSLYLLPTFIASRRRHRNMISIALVNIFLGWSGLGWFAALLWSCTADVEKS